MRYGRGVQSHKPKSDIQSPKCAKNFTQVQSIRNKEKYKQIKVDKEVLDVSR